MLSTLIKIGPVSIHSYGLLIGIGFIVSWYFMRRDARTRHFNPDHVTDLAFWGLLWGIIGTRVFHILLFPSEYSWSDPIGWIAVWRGGLVFQGAFPPVILVFIIYCKKHHLPIWKMADIVCPYIPLGHAFGRLGCFMHGCCFGKTCQLPWAVSFPAGSPAWDLHQRLGLIPPDAKWSLAIHPTQLYSAGGLLIIFLILRYLRERWHPVDGFTFPAYLVLYSIFRFVVEFYRGDHNPTHFGNLSDQQVFCLVGVVVGVFIYAMLIRRKKTSSQHS